MLRWRRRTLVDLLRHRVEHDPGDAPALHLQDAVDLDRMHRDAPAAVEPAGGVPCSCDARPRVGL